MTNPHDPRKAIILGCRQAGLAIVHSFAKKGIDTLVLVYNDDEPGLASRFVKQWHKIPHPRDEKAFVDSLLQYKEEWGGALILETNDYYATALSRNKAILSEHYRLVTPDYEMIQTFLQKDKTYQIADESGVPHPKIHYPQSMEELDAVIDDIQFPAMIKPVNSHEFVILFKEKLIITDTPDELRENFQKVLDANQAVVISEIIPGTDYLTLERLHIYINSKGESAAELSNTKVRQTPPMYGVMRVGRSTPPNKEVVELALRFLKSVDYRGFASVEFKRDYRDNQLKLMEINIRMPRSTPLPITSGVDLPYIIYEDLVNDNQIIVEDYHHETYLIEIVADIADFIRRDTDHDLRKFLQPYLASSKVFPYLRLSDPMPFLREIQLRGARFVNKLLRRKSTDA